MKGTSTNVKRTTGAVIIVFLVKVLDADVKHQGKKMREGMPTKVLLANALPALFPYSCLIVYITDLTP